MADNHEPDSLKLGDLILWGSDVVRLKAIERQDSGVAVLILERIERSDGRAA